FSGFTIRNGRANNGAGIFLDSSTPILTRHLITGNHAVRDAGGYFGFGGGISAYDSAPMITNTLIIGNSAERNGGGIDLYFSYPLVTNTTIVGNTATAPPGEGFGYGGGMYLQSSAPEMHSNIIIDNISDAGGGGVDLINSSFTTIDYSNAFANSPVDLQGIFGGNVGNISTDPWLVSMSPLALCPRSDSPVLDTPM
ncbi:MAG: right-handed parallel beta-helix repeat-containing protein, partial [Candidatus Thorarchaeota archaeon]